MSESEQRSQISDIKTMEETVKQLFQQVADMREQADKTDDPELRKTLLEVADGCETAAKDLASGLRGMRESFQ